MRDIAVIWFAQSEPTALVHELNEVEMLMPASRARSTQVGITIARHRLHLLGQLRLPRRPAFSSS